MYTQINIKHFAVQEKRQLGREGGAGTGVGGVAIDIWESLLHFHAWTRKLSESEIPVQFFLYNKPKWKLINSVSYP